MPKHDLASGRCEEVSQGGTPGRAKAPLEPAVPTAVRFGSYELRELLGAGGMGEVYRAHDSRLGRDVAVKILPPHLAGSTERLARFTREARLLAALSHPNIAVIYDVEESLSEANATVRAIVLELVDGETLAERIAAGPIPLGVALRIAVQIAGALEAAHEKGITHRDLKPANMKVTPEGIVKVLDFGLAKADDESLALGAPQSVTITLEGSGAVLGTIAYMSPEQARGLPVDRRADLWAFGAILYEMLTGNRAFGGDSASDTLAHVLMNEPDWHALPRDTPPRVRTLLARCLRKDARQRLADAGAARIELEDAESGALVSAQAARPRATSRERLAWSVAAVAVVIGTIAGLPFFRPTSEAAESVRFFVSAPETFSLAQLPREPLSTAPLAVSPDGRRIALVVTTGDGRSMLAIRALDSLDARVLSGTDGATSPFWSPDGGSLGFFADEKLKSVAVSGGPSKVLCSAPANQGGAWGRDGSIVFSSSPYGPLLKVSASGGAPSPVTVLGPGEIAHVRPFFLPDGRHAIYRSTRGVGGGSVYVTSLDSHERKLLMDADSTNVVYSSGHLLFLRGMTLMAQAFDAGTLGLQGEPFPIAESIHTMAEFATNLNGFFSASTRGVLAYQTGASVHGSQLTWFDRHGRQEGIVGDPGTYGDLELSPDGRRASVFMPDQTNRGTQDVWVYDLDRGVRTRVTSDAGNDVAAIWSPDGTRMVFGSDRDRALTDMYEKSLGDAGGGTLLLQDDTHKYPRSWSPDGRFVLFSRNSPVSDLWILPMSGDRKPTPFLQTQFSENFGQFSPDGRWVAYFSDESGRSEVYVAPFPGPGERHRVSAGGGVLPRWRRDGAELFYFDLENTLIAAAVNGHSDRFEVGAITPLFRPRPRRGAGFPYDVSADGQHFLVNTLPQQTGSTPITVVLNWTAAYGVTQ